MNSDCVGIVTGSQSVPAVMIASRVEFVDDAKDGFSVDVEDECAIVASKYPPIRLTKEGARGLAARLLAWANTGSLAIPADSEGE